MINESTLRKLTAAAPQPGPWTVQQQGDRWVVLDANGMWVCDVGVDEADARFIAAANPKAIRSLFRKLDRLRKALEEACDIGERATRGESSGPAAASRRIRLGELRKVGAR